MLRGIKQYLAIAKNAFVVALSDPVFLVLMLTTLGAMVLVSTLPTFNFGQELRLVRDQVLAMAFIGGCVAAALGAVIVVVNDLRHGAVAVLMSRPVSPLSYVAGKWSGLGAALGLYMLTATVAVLWMTRVFNFEDARNQVADRLTLILYFASIATALAVMGIKHYFFGGWYVWQANVALAACLVLGFLVSCFFGFHGQAQSFGANVNWSAAWGGLMLWLAQLLFAAVLMPLAVKLDPAALAVSALLVFGLGLVADWATGSVLPSGVVQETARAVLPNWRPYWIADYLAGEVRAGYLLRYLGALLIHTGAYTGICLIAGTLLFSQREFSASENF